MTDAQEHLGVLILEGEHAYRSIVETQKELSLASERGPLKASRLLESVNQEIDASQIKENRRLAGEFHQQSCGPVKPWESRLTVIQKTGSRHRLNHL